ncbi:thioredoxin domain-containing protein 15-like [Watersipora subatra]|uniref:thioredoxin domain-containing protein 15-like n=1 Tax=Watersipora subatra TaxID=2589382 RepID=UPI00355AE5D2
MYLSSLISVCWLLFSFGNVVQSEYPQLQQLPILQSTSKLTSDIAADTSSEALDVCVYDRKADLFRLLTSVGEEKEVKKPNIKKHLGPRQSFSGITKYLVKIIEYLFPAESSRGDLYTNKDAKIGSLKEESDRVNTQDSNKMSAEVRKPANCTLRQNSSADGEVILVNDTLLQQLLKNEKTVNGSPEVDGSAPCQILLLYAPWCPFSARLAPHYNALGRIFPDLEALAINAVTLNYWNARFGTVAVPNVLLFHNGKFIAKYNYTEKNIQSFTHFIQNFTNLNSSLAVDLMPSDYLGPVPTEVLRPTDYYLILSWAVIGYALLLGCYRCGGTLRRVCDYTAQLFHYDHDHLD